MVIIQLKGGLGNQMFQFAAARKTAMIHNVPLKFDLSFLEADATHHTKRYFELHKLDINAGIATMQEIQALKKQRWKNLFYPTWIKDRGVDDFLKKTARSRDQVYLDGYFQSEKYFNSISGIIREELTFKQPLEGEYFQNILHRIESLESVSLHFRRGDYITDSKTNKYHGVCSMNYYQKAVEKIEKKINSAALFIFSDDIPWVKAHFNSHLPTVFIEQSDEERHSDFRLMSSCKHNIIANSSYSWWAAWLNDNKKKTVIAPEKWYEDPRTPHDTADILPDEWIKL